MITEGTAHDSWRHDVASRLNVSCAEENADLGMVYGRPAVKREATVHSKASQVPAADMAAAPEEQHRPAAALIAEEEPCTMTDEQQVQLVVSS